ncbi:hypothetical protein HRG_002354 [Hirsutella rhossiliensis]|uniref:Uncharacterized protein n=1 Tax=Hirsutella rhossiliensis TaxID=111463 RepID=A0A9P8N4U4_9HYPO|nr:uncharacterized protein HRG_02354 [Hirsutella rhossiliensis]KAH0966945.1 hypothetical protein HRG_02354 [Hirsutella rhossiliensis]
MVISMTCPPEYGASAARSSCKPAKATACHKLRPSQSQLLDPDELTRRLSLLLAEQNGHAPSKRRTIFGAAWRTPQVGFDASAPLNSDRGEHQRHPAYRHGIGDAQQGRRLHKHKLHLTSSKKSSGCSDNGGEPVRSSSYRHVPQVAASQFARTTTADSTAGRQLIHRLSQKAIKFHLDGPNASREIAAASPNVAPFKQAQALRRVQSMRERQYGRNQFHYTPTLATMTEIDEQRPPCHHRHTLEPYSGPRLEGHEGQKDSAKRRRSTGNILGKPDASPKGPFIMPVSPAAAERRGSGDALDPSEHHPVDWTQSDETWAQPTVLVASPQPLRKPESKWDLRGRLGSLTRHGRGEKTPSPPQERRVSQDSPKSPKSPTGGLFARFKR